MDTDKKIRELAARTERLWLKRKRYPVILILPSDVKENWEEIFRGAAVKLDGTYTNYLVDVLGSKNPPVIGAFSFSDLIKWMKTETLQRGPLFVSNIDPIITTWKPDFRKAFYKEFLHTELPWKKPIITNSFMGAQYHVVHKETGSGLVLDGNLQKIY